MPQNSPPAPTSSRCFSDIGCYSVRDYFVWLHLRPLEEAVAYQLIVCIGEGFIISRIVRSGTWVLLNCTFFISPLGKTTSRGSTDLRRATEQIGSEGRRRGRWPPVSRGGGCWVEASWARGAGPGGGQTVAGARPYKPGETSELECAEVQTACPTGGRLPGRAADGGWRARAEPGTLWPVSPSARIRQRGGWCEIRVASRYIPQCGRAHLSAATSRGVTSSLLALAPSPGAHPS